MPEQQVDEAVASSYGLASFHLQNAILTTLVAKGHLTMKEAALTIRGAHYELKKMKPAPMGRELHALALQALTILSEGWDKQARGR
jgi:hypothetical protein